jgi:hypothetical protein
MMRDGDGWIPIEKLVTLFWGKAARISARESVSSSTMSARNGQFLLAGSQKFTLMKNVSEPLAGRGQKTQSRCHTDFARESMTKSARQRRWPLCAIAAPHRDRSVDIQGCGAGEVFCAGHETRETGLPVV